MSLKISRNVDYVMKYCRLSIISSSLYLDFGEKMRFSDFELNISDVDALILNNDIKSLYY